MSLLVLLVRRGVQASQARRAVAQPLPDDPRGESTDERVVEGDAGAEAGTEPGT